MRLSKEELSFIQGALRARRIYKDTPLPNSIEVWKPFMENFLEKVNTEMMERYSDEGSWRDI